VQRRLDDLVGDGAEIGLQVAACVDGQLALDAWAGVADRATGRPVDGETPFTVFSATKGVARRLLARGAPGAASPLAPSTSTGYAGGPARGLGSGHFRPRAVGRLREGAMRYRRLGRTGVQLSRFSLGASFFGTRIGRDEAAAILHRALDLGVNVVDTAESYLRPEPLASEAVLGEILPGVRRDLFLATKVGPARTWEEPAANQGLSRRVVMQALDGSLRRLKTDHVDLLYAHFPDPATPLEETLGAIEDLVRAGKVRYAGLSNHSAARVAEALWTADRHGWRPIVATQDLYNPRCGPRSGSASGPRRAVTGRRTSRWPGRPDTRP